MLYFLLLLALLNEVVSVQVQTWDGHYLINVFFNVLEPIDTCIANVCSLNIYFF